MVARRPPGGTLGHFETVADRVAPGGSRTKALLDDYKTFVAEYGDALVLWTVTGKAEFPAGTNKMSTYPGTSVRSRPSAAMRG